MRTVEESPDFGSGGGGTSARPVSLLARRDSAGMAQLARHLGLAGITGAAVYACAQSVWLVPAMLAHGIVLVFLFAPLHECMHRSAFATRRLNDAVAWLCGALLLLPPAYFRAFHFTHHRHTQDPHRDPELARPRPATLAAYLRELSGLPYWYERVSTTLRHAEGRVREQFIDAHAAPFVVRDARLLLSALALLALVSLALGSDAGIRYWLAPVLLGQPVLRAFLLAEHWGCPLVDDMRRNSRTTLTNRWLRRLCWNMCFHTAHHVNPGVPFHALPAYHERLAGRIPFETRGYVALHRQILGILSGDGRAAAREER